MNPRDFCREEGYETALILTYSFDPLFFERVALRDLWAGGTNECVVVADPHALEDSLVRAAGQVRYLGRRYRLTTPPGEARQHAKLMLRAGPSGALVWMGSGNATFGGWGENKELATAWRIDPGDKQAVALFAALVESIAPLLHGAAEQVLEKVRDLPWLSGAGKSVSIDPELLLSNETETLATQLARRWEGRKFHTVTLLTGSTDSRGAFLEWTARTFGVKKAVIGLDPENSDFDPKKLKKLPVDIQVIPLPSNPMPHAKFYFFEGRKDSAAIMGSANCSAAAWLASLNAGGNTELVMVYDHCERKQVRAVLNIVEKGTAVAIEEALDVVDRKIPRTGPTAIVRVLEFGMDGMTGDLRLMIAPGKAKVVRVTALFGEFQYELDPCDKNGRVFSSRRPDLPFTTSTHFARLIFKLQDRSVYEILRWLDEEGELAQTSLRRRVLSIERLGAVSTPSEQRQIINDIAEVTRAIFAGNEFREPDFAPEKRKDDEDKKPPAVNPHDLVRSIEQIPERPTGSYQMAAGNSLPIHGIIRLLFENPRKPGDENFEEEDLEEDETLIQSNDVSRIRQKENKNKEEPSEAFKTRLINQIEEFIGRAFETDFLSECTAIQLLQATVFPLAVATRGRTGNWIDDLTAVDWSSRILDLLFNTRIMDKNGDAHKGALELIQHRYAKARRSTIASDVLGNGILWAALIRIFTQLNWKDTYSPLVRALYFADLFDAPILYAHADPETILNTVGTYLGRQTTTRLLKEAATIARHVKELEECLINKFEALCEQQKGCMHEEGDLVYRPQVGFGWVQGNASIEAKQKVPIYLRRNGAEGTFYCDWYCNVYLAAKNSKKVAKIIETIKARS